MEYCLRAWAGRFRAYPALVMSIGQVLSRTTAAHYDIVASIEHEDRVFEGDEELVKRGFYLSRDILKPYIH